MKFDYGRGAASPHIGLAETTNQIFAHRYATSDWDVCKYKYVTRLPLDCNLVPSDATVLKVRLSQWQDTVLFEGADYWARIEFRRNDRSALVEVICSDPAVADKVIAHVESFIEPTQPDTVPITFWYWEGDHSSSLVKNLSVPTWSAIQGNYSAEASTELGRLMALSHETVSGKLLLMHGPPGTGKTTAIRALADAWAEWCDVSFIVDPERLFADSGYLMGMLSNTGDKPSTLIVLEDCDELITAEAKARTGQGLSRLLNIADGILGQGIDLRLCLTTNEPLVRLHPAIVRPGRCLAQIHVGKMSRTEATAWLGTSDGIGNDGATLAELYALRNTDKQIMVAKPDVPVGQYL